MLSGPKVRPTGGPAKNAVENNMETMLTPKKPSDGKARKTQNGGGRSGASTSPAQKALITRNLRIAFDEVAGEQIPQQMLDLLNQLSAKEGASESEG